MRTLILPKAWRSTSLPLVARLASRALLALPFLAPHLALAQGIAAAPPVLGMAVDPPDHGMAIVQPAPVPESPSASARQSPMDNREVLAAPGRRRFRGLGSGFADAKGQLPNQRTGQHHEHVVRDICIGC